MNDENDDEISLVAELQRLWALGARPSALVRELTLRGKRGVEIIMLMRRAFALSVADTSAVSAWFHHEDDARLDQFLVPRMPDRP